MSGSNLARVLRCRLRDDGISLSQRLKLSKKVVRSNGFGLSLGEPVIFEWIIETLNNSVKEAGNTELLKKLWKICHLILNSMTKNETNKLEFEGFLHSNLAKLLTNGIRSFSSVDDCTKRYMLDSSCIIISSSGFLNYFSRNFENYVIMLASVVELIVLEKSDDSYSLKLHNLLKLLFDKSYTTLKQVDEIKAFEICTRLLLKPASQLIDCYGTNLYWEDALHSMMNFIGKCMFNSALESHYVSMFISLFENSQESHLPEFLQTFLLSLQTPSFLQVETGIASVFPHLFNSFLKQYKHLPNKMKLYFFILLVRLLGVELCFSQKSSSFHQDLFKTDFVDSENTLRIIADIIMIIGSSPDVNDGDDELDRTLWLGILTEFLVNKFQSRTASWFKCFSGLLVVHPLNIISKIKAIFERGWLEVLQVDSDTLVCQSKLFVELVETYGKLNQIPKLITKILEVASIRREHMREINGRIDFPTGVSAKFGEIFVQLPPFQTINILKTLNNHLLESCFPALSGDTGQVNEFAKWMIYPPLELLRTLLQHARLMDVNLPKGGLSEVIEILHSISTSCIPRLILNALAAKDISLLQTSLLLAHDWGELHIALMHYNKLYVEIWNALKNPTVSSGSFTDLSLVHFYIGAHEWDLISEVILDVKDPVLLYIYALLIIQNMKAINLFGGAFPELELSSLKSSASYLASLAFVSDKTSEWDGQIFTLSNTNVAVGTWSLICQNLACILPFLSFEDIKHVAEIVVLTFSEEATSERSQSRCSMNLIKSQQFQELLAFHSAVMTTTLDSILDDFRKMTSEAENHDTIQEKVRELLTTLVSKPNAWMCLANSRPDGEFNDMWLLVKEAAGQLTDLMTLSRSVELITPNERYPVSSILNKLLLLHHLPLEFFVPGSQMQCLFGIFAVLMPFIHGSQCTNSELEIVIFSLKLILRVLDGSRSIWFFDFINDKDLLLWMFDSFTNFEQRLFSFDVDFKLRNTVKEMGIHCLQSFTNFLIRDRTFCAAVEQFLTEVELSPSWKDVNFHNEFHFNINVISVLLNSFYKIIDHVSDQYYSCIDRLTTKLLQWLFNFKSEHPVEEVRSVEAEASIIENFTMILNFAMNSGHEEIMKTSSTKKWKKLIPYMMCLAMKASILSKDCIYYENSCRMLCCIFKNRQALQKYVKEDAYKDIWKCLENMVFCHNNSCSSTHTGNLEKIVEDFIISTDVNEVTWIFTNILADLNVKDLQFADCTKLHALLGIWYKILSIPLQDNKRPAFASASLNFIILCQYILQQVGTRDEFLRIAVDILNAEAEMVKNQCSKATGPRLTLCLQGCSFVNLLSITDYEIFDQVFHGVYKVLNNIVVFRPSFVSCNGLLFWGVMQDLIHSIIQKGQQHILMNANEKCVNIICGCAQNVVRLCNKLHDPQYKFSKIARNILIHFIVRSSVGTLYPAVKNHLTEGMYAVLDLCNDKAISALMLDLSPSCQETFTNLHKSYKLYYHYNGRI